MKLYHATLSGLANHPLKWLPRTEALGTPRARRPTPDPPARSSPISLSEARTRWVASGTTLVVEVPDEVAVQHEVVDRYPGDEDSGFREFLLPAAIANRYPIERMEDV